MRFKYYLRGAGIGVIAATLILSVAFLFHDNISDEEVIRRAMKLGMVMQENTSGTLADPPQSGASSVDLETGTDPDPLAEQDGADPSADPNTAPSPDQPSEPDAGADTGQSDSPADGNAGGDTSQPSDNNANGDTSQPPEPKADENTDPPTDSKADDASKDKSKDKSKDQKKDQSSDTKAEDEVEIVIASGDVSRMVSAKVFEAGLVDDADEFNSYLGSHDYDNMLQPGTYKIKKGSSFQQIAKILTRQ